MPKGQGSSATGRHSKHTARACSECRRRKTKCNGKLRCNTCNVHDAECVYSTEPDGRSTNWKERAKNLALKIKSLSKKLRHYKKKFEATGGEVSPPGSEPGSPVDADATGGVLPFPVQFPVETFDRADMASISPDDKFTHPAAVTATRVAERLSINIPTRAPVYDPLLAPNSSAPTTTWSGSRPFFCADPSTSVTSFSSSSHPSALSPCASGDPALLLAVPLSSGRCGPSSSSRTHSDVGHPSPVRNPAMSDRGSSSISAGSFVLCQDAAPPRVALSIRDGEEPLAVNSTSILSVASLTGSPHRPYPAPSGPAYGLAGPYALSPIGIPMHYDWSRYLPQPLRESWNLAEHDAALKLYFEHVSNWQTPVIGQLFFVDMRNALGPSSDGETLHYSPGLHCAILANAGALLPPTSMLAHPNVRTSLAVAARELIDADCERNVRLVPSILGLVVLARYYLSSSRGLRMSYAIVSAAGALALSGGMNSDPLSPQVPQPDTLERQWCYISLFNQTMEIAVHTGQNVTIPPGRDAAQLQSQINPLSMRDRALGNVVASDTFVFSSQLFVEMYTALTRPCTPGLRLSVADRVETLRRHVLERGVQGDFQVTVLNAAFFWALLVIRHPEPAGDSHEKYDAAASQLLDLTSRFSESRDPSSVPIGLSHMVFSGSLAALNQPDARFAIQAYLYLRWAQSAWKCAEGFADFLWTKIAPMQIIQSGGQSHFMPPIAYTIASPIAGPSTGRPDVGSILYVSDRGQPVPDFGGM
ncbi:hypothetical protein AURDEDRAFT_125065 [Auricularia subglabra TFB-10046 SS5]|nr:hypothetical protein AURDEDRAFT_125065 [Auricularia subglabra TFB-10046 SS5]